MNQLSDEVLVNAVLAGDKSAFAELVRRYEPAARSAAVAILRRAPGSRRFAGVVSTGIQQPGKACGPLALRAMDPQDRTATSAVGTTKAKGHIRRDRDRSVACRVRQQRPARRRIAHMTGRTHPVRRKSRRPRFPRGFARRHSDCQAKRRRDTPLPARMASSKKRHRPKVVLKEQCSQGGTEEFLERHVGTPRMCAGCDLF